MSGNAEALRLRKVKSLGIKGVPAVQATALDKLNLLAILVPQVLLIIPLTLVWKHLITRPVSGVVQKVGRGALPDFMVRISRFFIDHTSAAQGRLLLDRVNSYEKISKSGAFKGYQDWVGPMIEWKGVTGRWIAKPNTDRSKDDVVFLMVHGGGFLYDTGANSQVFFLKLAKVMNLQKHIAFSVFLADHELAPEHCYPSQIIETLGAYHYLVNELGIAEDKICLGGDSAGGNIIAGFLLHLARPNPSISLPAASKFGPTPSRPGSVCFISPHVNVLTASESTLSNSDYDCIGGRFGTMAIKDYIGVPRSTYVPSWNPVHAFSSPYPVAAVYTLSTEPYTKDGKGMELLNSPYVNMSVCKDAKWWSDACPGEGRTMVMYGDKEILRDDVVEFIARLEASGVAPVTSVKEFGMHDGLFFDEVIPGLHASPSLGPESKKNYSVDALAEFLQGNDLIVRKKFWAAKSSAGN